MAISKVPPRNIHKNSNTKIPFFSENDKKGESKTKTRVCGSSIKTIIAGTFVSCPTKKTSQPIVVRCDNLRIMNGFPTGEKYLPKAILEARQRKISFTITNKEIISKLNGFNISLDNSEMG